MNRAQAGNKLSHAPYTPRGRVSAVPIITMPAMAMAFPVMELGMLSVVDETLTGVSVLALAVIATVSCSVLNGEICVQTGSGTCKSRTDNCMENLTHEAQIRSVTGLRWG